MKTIIHFHLIIISSVLLSVDSCKNKKSATTTSSANTTTQQQTTTTTSTTTTITNSSTSTTPKDDTMIRFVVSFFSNGEGIDRKVHDAFVKFLDSYPKKISYAPKHWGREGEIDYCLALTELSAAEQTEFVKKANELLAKSKLVHQKENSICEHADWPPLIINAPEAETYRLVVSFYSKGEGIDGKINEAFVKFLDSNSKKIAYESTHWGREGEIDYCLKLSELSPSEQDEFVKKAKDLLAKSLLVHIDESVECVHKH